MLLETVSVGTRVYMAIIHLINECGFLWHAKHKLAMRLRSFFVIGFVIASHQLHATLGIVREIMFLSTVWHVRFYYVRIWLDANITI